MNKIILYSTGCPKCGVLAKKLNKLGISYETVMDVKVMKEKGLMSAPALEVDGTMMNFSEAIKWVSEYAN